MVDVAAIRRQQRERKPGASRIGVGFAVYTEQSGHGVVEWSKRKSRVVPGYEAANVRMLPDGSVNVHVGVQNHGQGHETTLAQIAAHELGMDPAQIKIRYGDTATTPFGFGTFASRSIVFAGGAVATTSRKLARQDQGHRRASFAGRSGLGRDPRRHGDVGRRRDSDSRDRARGQRPAGTIAGRHGADARGERNLRARRIRRRVLLRPHAVVVSVDEDTGVVEDPRLVVAEDCGTMINPMIVDGQVQGGIAQGIGTGLFEEIPFNEDGQPLATTFADYIMPCASEVPTVRICAFDPPALVTEYGVKGVGEGGAIAPPAALANAVADAFRDRKASFNETPLTPSRVWEASQAACARKADGHEARALHLSTRGVGRGRGQDVWRARRRCMRSSPAANRSLPC